MLSLFGFGKKRRSRRKVSRKGRKGSRKMSSKPPARLLSICKKYHVKATMKRGSKRVYKSIAVLKKACIKKVKAAMKAAKMRKMSFGAPARRRRCGGMAFGAGGVRRRRRSTEFGKRSGRAGSRKMSKAAAMKAFRQFYKRHCAAGRGSRFGNGGNPALAASMGYQFCPSGMGGVLGANSTGMFPTPCMSFDPNQAAAERAVALPKYTSFGRKRRTCKSRKTRKAPCRRRKVSTCRRRKSRKTCGKTTRRRRGPTMRRRRRRDTTMFGLKW